MTKQSGQRTAGGARLWTLRTNQQDIKEEGLVDPLFQLPWRLELTSHGIAALVEVAVHREVDAITKPYAFSLKAPVNYVCLHCIEPSLRPLSMAMSTVSIHIFGDVPSSPLVGVLQWTSPVMGQRCCTDNCVFLHAVDRFNEDGEHGVPPVQRSNQRPLLEANPEASEESS
ncbi:putative sphingolipid transporter spinster like 2 [Apostasia shenzhenica]|uniref:Putative sphingolipid transporter spinster like 2 n=1 Tax=Apostasia shenzhenica TaxID=1088818 RepID=A0A2H9ZVY8_9ASPA|nr:putative sphingolipid transporter spinster like 2 [Apostasia shenzhenica]